MMKLETWCQHLFSSLLCLQAFLDSEVFTDQSPFQVDLDGRRQALAMQPITLLQEFCCAKVKIIHG
jgi:hypothetical protein